MFSKASALTILMFIAAAGTVFADDYVIGEGDVLYVSVWGEKDLSLSVKVRPDGKITIPALGDVSAAGNTTYKLQEHLISMLRKIIKNPVATVIVEEITNNKVYLFGGGVAPGVLNLTRRTTLLQLLCQIEDLSDADLERAYVLRGEKRIKISFSRLFINGDMSEDIVLRPDDLIFIPALIDKNVYVVGAVNEPKSIAYREGMTVMEAVLEAGGFSKFAKLSSTVIFRDRDRKEKIRVNIKELVNDGDLSQNVRLRPGDYVIVREGLF